MKVRGLAASNVA